MYQTLVHSSVLLVVFGLGGCGEEQPLVELDPSGPTVIQNVTVFDATSGNRLNRRDVWVQGDQITKIGATGRQELAANAVVVDGEGRTLLPGLIDAHVHVTNTDAPPGVLELPDAERALQKFLYAGITTVLDLGGPGEELAELRAELRAGRLAGPDLLFAGEFVTAEGGLPASMMDIMLPWPLDWFVAHQKVYQVETTAEIGETLNDLADAQVDWVKLMFDDVPLGAPQLSEELLAFAANGAHTRGYPVAVHIGSDQDARLAAQHGADMLAHGVYLDAYTDATLAELAEQKTAVVSTLGVFRNMDRVFRGEYEPVPYLQELQGPDQIEDLKAGGDDEPPEEIRPWLEALHANQDQLLPNARVLGEYGVDWLVGSDAPFIGWTAGQALHVELELLVEAGYRPAEVLQAATARNARVLNLSDRGQIREGLRADLLLVEGDPTESIAQVHEIVEVFKAGRRVRRFAP